MDSRQFRRKIKRETPFPNPSAFYAAVLMMVGDGDYGHVYNKSWNVISEMSLGGVGAEAHTRFMNWWELNNPSGARDPSVWELRGGLVWRMR
jgi:hypothetical protein